MMEEVVDLSSDHEGNSPKSRDDIVKEVASAIEEEDFLKDDSSSKKPASTPVTATSPQQDINRTYVKLGLSTSLPAAKVPESPTQQTIRSDSHSPIDPVSSSSTSTWQKPEKQSSSLKGVKIEDQEPEADQQSGGVWGWMSSAVNISGSIIQTTQNLGKNLVEKTKNSVDTVITTLDPGMEDYLHELSQRDDQEQIQSMEQNLDGSISSQHARHSPSQGMEEYQAWATQKNNISDYSTPVNLQSLSGKSEVDFWLAQFAEEAVAPNGREYGIFLDINEHMRQKWPGVSIFFDPEFRGFQSKLSDRILSQSQIERNKAIYDRDPTCFQAVEVERLWEIGALGTHNPDALLNALYVLTKTVFGIKGGVSHRNIKPSNFHLVTESKIVKVYFDGGKSVCCVRVDEQFNNERSFHRVFSTYMSKRHPNSPDIFYLRPLRNVQERDKYWFCYAPIGKNSFTDIFKDLKTKARKSLMERPPPATKRVRPSFSAKANQSFSHNAPTNQYSAAGPSTGFICGTVGPPFQGTSVVLETVPFSSLSREQETYHPSLVGITGMHSPGITNQNLTSVDRHLIPEDSRTQSPHRKRTYSTMSQEQDMSNCSQQIPTIEQTDTSSLSSCKTLLNQVKGLLPEEINVLWNNSKLGTFSPEVLLDTVLVFLKRLVGVTIDQDYSDIKLTQFEFLEEAGGLTCVVLTDRAPVEGNEGLKSMLVEKTIKSTERSDVRKSFTAVYNFYMTTRPRGTEYLFLKPKDPVDVESVIWFESNQVETRYLYQRYQYLACEASNLLQNQGLQTQAQSAQHRSTQSQTFGVQSSQNFRTSRGLESPRISQSFSVGSPYSLQHADNTENYLLLNSSQSTVQNIHSEMSCPRPAHSCRSLNRGTSHSVVTADKEIRKESEHISTSATASGLLPGTVSFHSSKENASRNNQESWDVTPHNLSPARSSRQVAAKTPYLQSTAQIHDMERLSFYPAMSGADKRQTSSCHYDSIISSNTELNRNVAVHQQSQSSAAEESSTNIDCAGTGAERNLVFSTKTIGTMTEPLSCLNCGCRQSLVTLGRCSSQQLGQSQKHMASQHADFLESTAEDATQFDNGIKVFHLGRWDATRNTDCGNMADITSAPSSNDVCVNLDIVYGRGQSVTLTLTSKDCEVGDSLKDGFRQVFEHAVIKCQPSVSNIAPLPVGHSAGLKATQHRVMHLRRTKKVTETEVVVGVEEMIAELVPGKWFGVTCLCLSDPTRSIELETFSQAVAIPTGYVKKAEQSTPSNYPLRWSGLSFTLGEVILGNGKSSGDWQAEISGSSKRQILTAAARTLAGQYRAKIKANMDSLMEKAVHL